MSLAVVTLKKGEGRLLKSGGMWIFDNEIATIMGSFVNGDIVLIHDFDGYPLGKGFINTNSKITVRLLTRDENQKIDEEFLEKLVRLVDFEPDEIKVADIQVPKFDRLVSVQGSQTEISTKLKELAGQDEKILVEVIHTGKANAINLTGEVSEQTSGTKIEVLRVFDETKKANCLANDGDEMEIGELTWENVFEKKLKNEAFEGEVSEEELWNAYRNAYFQISELADVNAQ